MAPINTALPTAYDTPTTVTECYDNLTLLFCYIKGVFDTIAKATQEHPPGIASVAELGGILTAEADARAEALYAWMKTHQPETEED